MSKLEIAQIIARSDNFAVIIHDAETGETAAIDAPAAAPILDELRGRGWTLTHILVTHKHMDHVEGIPELKAAHNVTVIGPEKSAASVGHYDRTVKDGDTFTFGGRDVRVIATPGHTLDHVSYYIPDDAVVFAADTLFAMGCGRVFEGTPDMMWDSLKKLRALPDDTSVYCGHEYTLANARFAVTADPDNAALASRLKEVEELRKAGKPTLPTTIAREKQTNPFLRADDPAVAEAMGMAGGEPATVFAEIRARKDRF